MQNLDDFLYVWLDDERPMPKDYNTHVTTAEQAIELLKTGKVKVISLDHDLGSGKTEGIAVAKYIEEAAFHGTLEKIRVYLHTQNPVGKQNMKAAMRNALTYWMQRQ